MSDGKDFLCFKYTTKGQSDACDDVTEAKLANWRGPMAKNRMKTNLISAKIASASKY